jgi:Cu/Ag efflux protein CusF
MNIRRITVAFVASSALATAAFAGDAPTTATPAPAPVATKAPAAAAVTHVTGVVKAWNAQTNQLTVTVNAKDAMYSTAGLTLDPAVKAGANVDVTLTGAKVTAVVLHKA